MSPALKDCVKYVAAMTAQRRNRLKNVIAGDFRRIEAKQSPKYLPKAWWQQNLPAQERLKLKREVLVIFRRAEWFALNKDLGKNQRSNSTR